MIMSLKNRIQILKLLQEAVSTDYLCKLSTRFYIKFNTIRTFLRLIVHNRIIMNTHTDVKRIKLSFIIVNSRDDIFDIRKYGFDKQ